MPRKTRGHRVHEDMRRLGVKRDDEVCFGRPCVEGTNIPIASLAERFAAGEGLQALANDYMPTTQKQITNAIRFAMLWPKSDLPSFWKAIE
jgi:uncharacterized protein (DUF433 family)